MLNPMEENRNRPVSRALGSVHDLPPLNSGGVDARRGFDVQDHVAAGLCIRMLRDDQLKAVWCESHDDITLIWEKTSGETAEFIQVKSSELDGLWSVAKLCEREGMPEEPSAEGEAPVPGKSAARRRTKKVGTSILERSLAYDRCEEPCLFRMVTCWQVHGELRILTYEPSCEHRVRSTEEMLQLISKIRNYVGDYRSPNGNDCGFWAERALWEPVGPIADIKNRNLVAFTRLIEHLGYCVFHDQVEEVYARLVSKAWHAATADWRRGREAKKIARQSLHAWLIAALEALRPAHKGGQRLREKMEKAHLPEDSVCAALEERNSYREELLTPRYFSPSEHRLIESEVAAALHSLRSQLDSGDYADDGRGFHLLCRNRLENLRNELPVEKRPPLAFLNGCMYHMADRCAHRFRRAEP